MRNTFAEKFYQLAKDDKRLNIVVADISPAGAMNNFRKDFPDRFVNTGVAEQIMISMVAGMAMRGLRPFAYTIATFALYRPFEFIRDDICYQNLPVTIVGIGGGVTYSTLGGTHHAQEDVSIARSLPNMRVLAPCDPDETKAITEWCAKNNAGPAYLRLGKAGEPNLSSASAEKFKFGKIRYLKKGSDICVLGYGTILSKAFDLDKMLTEKGVSISIVSIHSIKPIDEEGMYKILSKYKKIITLEEMSSLGGLADIIKSFAFDNKFFNCEIYNFSLKDKFIHCYGSHDDLLEKHSLTVKNIMDTLKI